MAIVWFGRADLKQKITVLTNNDLNKDLYHWSTFHFFGSTNTDATIVTRKDSESSENTSPGEDNVSESEEYIVLNDNTNSTDSSLSDDNDGYNEQNENTAEQLFTELSLFVLIYHMECIICILCICLFFDYVVSDIYQVTVQFPSDLQLRVFFFKK